MSPESSDPAGPAASSPNPSRRLSYGSLSCIFGAVLFIATGLFATAAAAVWVLGSFLHLHLAAMIVLSAIVAVPAIVVLVKTARMAWWTETRLGTY